MGECFIVRRGNARFTDIPNGETILPINDVKTWQRCAGLRPTYTTIDQILADSGCLSALLSTANSKEYFIRSLYIQSSVLSNSGAISVFDGVRKYINPDMTGLQSPYGVVSTTVSGGGGTLYNAFNTTNNAGYITNNVGSYIQWVQDKNAIQSWIYKFTIKDTYGNNSQVRIQGLLPNWELIDLTNTITLPYNTLVTVPTLPNDKKCVGLRLTILRQSQSANDYIYLNNLKMFGI